MNDLEQLGAYDSYLRRLDARALLDFYGATNCREQYNKDGTVEIVHSCLIDRVYPHHDNGDANPSAACNVEKKKYVCYTLGAGMDLLHFITVMEGLEELQGALVRAADFLTESVVPAETLMRELDRAFEENGYVGELPSYDESVLRPWAEGHPYWNERGITTPTMELLQLGYDPTARRIVFPHFVGGKLVGWQKRVIPRETFPVIPKYKNSPGLPKSSTLYAHDLTTSEDPVLVVESPMSVAKAYSLGMANVVATFGAKVNRAQIDLLKRHPAVIVWFDADDAGRQGERRLLEGLYRHTEVSRIVPTPGRDLADCASIEEATGLRVEPAVWGLAEYDVARSLSR